MTLVNCFLRHPPKECNPLRSFKTLLFASKSFTIAFYQFFLRHPLFFLFVPVDSRAGAGAQRAVDHAVIGGVVAVVVFAMLCLLIILGRYFARHKGT